MWRLKCIVVMLSKHCVGSFNINMWAVTRHGQYTHTHVYVLLYVCVYLGQIPDIYTPHIHMYVWANFFSNLNSYIVFRSTCWPEHIIESWQMIYGIVMKILEANQQLRSGLQLKKNLAHFTYENFINYTCLYPYIEL